MRPLTRVGPQVTFEAALLAESLSADAAGEWLQPSVDRQLVDVNAALCGESFLTCWTFEGFFLLMDFAVCRQVAEFRKRFPTLFTAELLLCFLTAQSVLGEAAPCSEHLSTGRAPEGPRVPPPAGHLVCPEVAAGAEHLPTVRAPVGPLLVVHGELVDSDTAAGGECFSTGGAAEGTLSAVDAQVSAQVGPSGESAAADAAAKGLSAAHSRCLFC